MLPIPLLSPWSSLKEATKAARKRCFEWIREADWGEGSHLIQASFKVEENDLEDEDECHDEWHSVGVEVHPEPPSCSEDEHDWQSPRSLVGGLDSNPGVFGNAGGVIIMEVCANCGTYKKTNTWDTCPATGQVFESVEYEDADDSSSAWAEKKQIKKALIDSYNILYDKYLENIKEIDRLNSKLGHIN